MNSLELKKFALEIRIEIVKAIAKKGGGHIGGSLSIADLLAVLYGDIMKYKPNIPKWDERDYLICSKGHAGPALYSVLGLMGFFPMEWLEHLNTDNTKLPGHCDRLKVPGVDATTGSLGQGLSIAVGVAHGLKVLKKDQKVFCITGDGEHAEGQIWEAITYAAHYHLGNLVAFLDWNKMQIDGPNDKVMSLGNIEAKYKSFGWNTEVICGSDVDLIKATIHKVIDQDKNKPTMIILDIIKGAGVPCIENMANNHCISFPQTLFEQSMEYLTNEYDKVIKESESCRK